MLNISNEAMRIYQADPKFKFYYAIALFLEGNFKNSDNDDY